MALQWVEGGAAAPLLTHGPRIGLALDGGGPLGAIYEVGALCAVEESIAGLDLADCHAYVGVSAGGIIAAALANRMTPRALCASFILNTGGADDRFDPAVLLAPAWGEFARRLAGLPPALGRAAWAWAVDRNALLAAERIGAALPTGLLSGARLEQQLRRQFNRAGRSNDFRHLRRKLVLVATELDTGRAIPFGMPGFDHVPVSRAVQASSALPGLYPPVEIDGRSYVDGALKKTLHASVLLDEGLDLLLCLNPLVPFEAVAPDASRVLQRGGRHIPKLVDGGLPVVLSQTFRTLIHSRLEIGMKAYEASHPDTDILLIEPDPRDAELFFSNTFGYAQRRRIAEHAYQHTRRQLRAQRGRLARVLARHRLGLDAALLDDPRRTLVGNRPPAGSRFGRALQQLEAVLDDLGQQVEVAQPR